jgi:hypothetical protein
MSMISKHEKLQDVLIRLLEQSRKEDSSSSATFDLDDALMELEVWHDMISDPVEDIYSDAEAGRLTHLALDTALDACQALETTPFTKLSSTSEWYALVCSQSIHRPGTEDAFDLLYVR